MLMAGGRSYFLNDSVVRGHHMYKPDRCQESMKRFRWRRNHAISMKISLFPCWRTSLMLALIHSTQHAPGDYARTSVYYCTELVTPGIKKRPSIKCKWHSGYSRQYSTYIYPQKKQWMTETFKICKGDTLSPLIFLVAFNPIIQLAYSLPTSGFQMRTPAGEPQFFITKTNRYM